MKMALILTDGKAGHENQSKAFARALGCGYDLAGVRFKSKSAKTISYLLDRLNIATTSLFVFEKLPESRPDVIIGTGSGTFYAAKALARSMGVKCGVVLYPRGYRISTFDCILAPSFDRPVRAANVIEVPTNLVANDEDFYARGVAAFAEHYATVNRRALAPTPNAVAVIIGGPNKCSTMTPEWVQRQLTDIFAEHNHGDDVEFWVTTSRRTPPEVDTVVNAFPWNYRLLYSQDHFNPIPAFVKLAKRLYVTAESTGMLSEACTFGMAEVEALDNLNAGNHKFRRFVDGLRAAGYVGGRRKVDLSRQFAAAKSRLGL